MDAATAGHRVGYESPSQFSREYSRLFGIPPATDMRRLRATALVPPAPRRGGRLVPGVPLRRAAI